MEEEHESAAEVESPLGDDLLEGVEVLSLKVELDLVPEWSNVLERIAKYYGERVAVGVRGGGLVVKVAVLPEKKEPMLADIQRTWLLFVDRRKREGRWRAT